MRINLTCGTLALAALVVASASARALVIAPPPGPARMAQADTVLVGRVVGIEPQDVMIEAFPGAQDKAKLRIAVVQVTEPVRGVKKEQKMVRVAFYPPPEQANDPNGGVRIRPITGGGRGNMQLTMGMEGLFILNKHHKENLYNPPAYFNFVASQAGNFKQEVEEAKTAGRILDNPKEALSSKNAQECFKAAAVMISYYRNFPPAAGHKFEPIDAEQSKLILQGLLDADWTPQPRRFNQLDPLNLFFQLGLTPKDGWGEREFRDPKEQYQAAQAWLKDNVAKYRIQKVVPTATAQNPGGININPVDPARPPLKVRPGIKIKPAQPAPKARIQPVDPEVQILPVLPPPRVEPAPPQRQEQ